MPSRRRQVQKYITVADGILVSVVQQNGSKLLNLSDVTDNLYVAGYVISKRFAVLVKYGVVA